MRPSAAIRTACAAASAVSGSSGSAGQTLCASSITISTGSRCSRRSHSAPSTAPATTDCSSRVASEPRSTTTQRAPASSTSSSTVVGASRAHTPSLSTPRLRAARRQRPVAVERRTSFATQRRGQLGVLVAVGDRVEPQQRRLRDRARAAKRSRRPRLGHAARRRPPRGSGRALAPSLLSRTWPRRTKSEFGSRITTRRLGVHQQPLEHHAERVRLAGAGLAAQERVPVEAARVERARHAGRERQLADAELRASGPRAVQPGADLVRYRRADQDVVERRAVAVDDQALAARVADRRPRCGRRGRSRSASTALAHLQRQHLAEPVVAEQRRSRRDAAAGRAATPGRRTGGRRPTRPAAAPTARGRAGSRGTSRGCPRVRCSLTDPSLAHSRASRHHPDRVNAAGERQLRWVGKWVSVGPRSACISPQSCRCARRVGGNAR